MRSPTLSKQFRVNQVDRLQTIRLERLDDLSPRSSGRPLFFGSARLSSVIGSCCISLSVQVSEVAVGVVVVALVTIMAAVVAVVAVETSIFSSSSSSSSNTVVVITVTVVVAVK